MIESRFELLPRQHQLKLGWALAFSVVLHVLIVIVTAWLSVGRAVPVREAAPAPPEKNVLRFAFAQWPEKKVAEPQPPAGEVPVEAPEPKREPSADLKPPPADPGQQQPQPRQSPATTASEPTESTAEIGGALREAGSAGDAPHGRLPERSAAEQRDDAEARTSQASRNGFDLRGAIEDFGRTLEKSGGTIPADKQGSGPPRNVFVPNATDLPTTGFGVGNLTFETRDFDWSEYARSIYWEIWRAWHNRLLRLASDFERWAYDNREPALYHEVRIRFVIEGTGEVTGIAVETPSGCIPLDQSATQALEEVILPALPEDFPKEREVVHARFLAQGEIRALRPHLERLKALNYF